MTLLLYSVLLLWLLLVHVENALRAKIQHTAEAYSIQPKHYNVAILSLAGIWFSLCLVLVYVYKQYVVCLWFCFGIFFFVREGRVTIKMVFLIRNLHELCVFGKH